MRGFLLLEGIIAAAITSIVLSAIAGVYLSTSQVHEGERIDTALLQRAHEGLVAARLIRDADSVNFSTGTFGVATSTGSFTFSGSSDVYGGLTREVEVTALDANTFEVISTVTDGTRTKSLSTYLSRWREVLSVGGIGDWTAPTEVATLDLSGNDGGVSIDRDENYAYVVRTGGNTNFHVLDIDPLGSISNVGSLTLAAQPQYVQVSGDYAYVAGTSNGAELTVIDVSTPSSPSIAATYNASGGQNANGLFIVGSLLYLVRDDGNIDELEIIDISTPTSPTKLGGIDINSDANRVVVLGSYAYVATDGEELEVVNVSVPAAPTSVVEYNLPGNSNGISIAGAGSVVYVGRANGEVGILSVASPSSPSLLGTFDAEDLINDISLDNSGQYAFLATSEKDHEFQVIDATDSANPVAIVQINVDDDFMGVVYDEDTDSALVVSDDKDSEVYVYQGN